MASFKNDRRDRDFGRLGVIQGHVKGNRILIDTGFLESHAQKKTYPRLAFLKYQNYVKSFPDVSIPVIRL